MATRNPALYNQLIWELYPHYLYTGLGRDTSQVVQDFFHQQYDNMALKRFENKMS